MPSDCSISYQTHEKELGMVGKTKAYDAHFLKNHVYHSLLRPAEAAEAGRKGRMFNIKLLRGPH